MALETEVDAFGTAARMAAAGFPRHWGGNATPAEPRATLTDGSVSFRDLRSRRLQAALAEVYAELRDGRTRRDQLLVDWARWRHGLPSRHVPLRLRTRVLHRRGAVAGRYV